mmetsp:Transcript_10995/g.19380  ORF Transcript_10995/g.19380 Transcript_10995/m.19380 type:complete len:327 (-) Transcript_10995:291-1271(-)
MGGLGGRAHLRELNSGISFKSTCFLFGRAALGIVCREGIVRQVVDVHVTVGILGILALLRQHGHLLVALFFVFEPFDGFLLVEHLVDEALDVDLRGHQHANHVKHNKPQDDKGVSQEVFLAHMLAVSEVLSMFDVVRGGHQAQSQQKTMRRTEMQILRRVPFAHTVREDGINDLDTEQIQADKARQNDPTDRTYFDKGDYIVTQHTTHVIGEFKLRGKIVIPHEELLNDLVLNLLSQLRDGDGDGTEVEEKLHQPAPVIHSHVINDQLFGRGVVVSQQFAVAVTHQGGEQARLDEKHEADKQNHNVREVKRIVPDVGLEVGQFGGK